MSDTSLYAGLYEEIREYAELVDEVILNLKKGEGTPENPAQKRLALLLMHLGRGEFEDLPIRLFMLVLRENGFSDQTGWSSTGKALLEPEIDASVINQLERVAQSLERGQTNALGRIRGTSH